MVTFRKSKPKDYKQLVIIHKTTFIDFFLTSLGDSFLRMYYKLSLKSKNVVAICATDENDHIIGFALGSVESVCHHINLVKYNLLAFMMQGFLLLFTKPFALIRLINNLEKNDPHNEISNYSELLSIGIIPGKKGLGIGKILLRKFEEEVFKMGSKAVALTTDYYYNEDVIAFYKKSDYTIFSKFIAYPNRRMFKLIKQLDSD